MTYTGRRNDSSHIQFRLRLPKRASKARGMKAVLSFPNHRGEDPFTVEVTLGNEVKFSLRTTDHAVARARDAEARAQLERYFVAAAAPPTQLAHKQIVGLSGAVYRLYVETHEDNPGSPGAWAAFKAFNRAAVEGRVMDLPPIVPGEVGDPNAAIQALGEDLTAGINALAVNDHANSLETRFGLLTDWLLAQNGFAIGRDERVRLLREVARASTDAAWRLKRNAQGDYTPDPVAQRFPALESARPLTITEIEERWRNEAKPSASTLASWKAPIASMIRFLGHEDARRISETDIIRWKDHLVAKGDLSPKTINDVYLASIKAIFNQAVRDRLIPSNPVANIRVSDRRQAGTGRLPYTDSEVRRLLLLAAQEPEPSRHWLPWLAAATGARIGELAQLWGCRVTTIEGVPVMDLRPAEDGGTFKNEASERTVPLHPALVEAGFLRFVAERGDGPLFYRRSSGDSSKRHASKGVTNRLAAWIREAGFNDPRKSPNHALRHWWKTAAMRAGVSDSIADAVQGHAANSVAGRYRHFDLKTLRRAVEAISVPPQEAEREVA